MSILFNGGAGDNSDYATIPYSSLHNFTTKFTIMAWLYPSAYVAGGQQESICKRDNAWALYSDTAAQKWGGYVRIGASTYAGNIDSATYSLNTIYHVAMTYDKDAGSNQLKIFVNGLHKSSGTSTSSVYNSTSTGVIILGKESTGAAANRSFHGAMEDTRFYNRALSANEIMNIFGCKGTDGIVEGLVAKYVFNEGAALAYPGAVPLRDLSINKLDAAASGNAKWRESYRKHARRYL